MRLIVGTLDLITGWVVFRLRVPHNGVDAPRRPHQYSFIAISPARRRSLILASVLPSRVRQGGHCVTCVHRCRWISAVLLACLPQRAIATGQVGEEVVERRWDNGPAKSDGTARLVFGGCAMVCRVSSGLGLRECGSEGSGDVSICDPETYSKPFCKPAQARASEQVGSRASETHHFCAEHRRCTSLSWRGPLGMSSSCTGSSPIWP
jgi:hypothetical protein